MYAVVKDDIIIDVGFGTTKSVESLRGSITYMPDNHLLIEVTEHNSPMTLGEKYLGDK